MEAPMTKPMTGTLNEYRVTYTGDDDEEYEIETFDITVAQMAARTHRTHIEERECEARADGKVYYGEWKVRIR